MELPEETTLTSDNIFLTEKSLDTAAPSKKVSLLTIINFFRKLFLSAEKILPGNNVEIITNTLNNSVTINNTMPIATAHNLGNVKVGTNLSIDETGLLSAVITPIPSFLYAFVIGSFVENQLILPLNEHNKGYNAIVDQFQRFDSKTNSYINVIYEFEQKINGDIYITTNAPFKGRLIIKEG